MTRIHELRIGKITYISSMEEFSHLPSESRNRFEAIRALS
jgi:hypothetical protein